MKPTSGGQYLHVGVGELSLDRRAVVARDTVHQGDSGACALHERDDGLSETSGNLWTVDVDAAELQLALVDTLRPPFLRHPPKGTHAAKKTAPKIDMAPAPELIDHRIDQTRRLRPE